MECCIGPEFIFNVDRAIRRLPLPSSQLGVTSSGFCLWTNWTQCFHLGPPLPSSCYSTPTAFPCSLGGTEVSRSDLLFSAHNNCTRVSTREMGAWALCSRHSTGFSRTPVTSSHTCLSPCVPVFVPHLLWA